MRSFREFVVDVVVKPPVLFPLAGLFHILWLGWTLWSDRAVHFPDIAWLEVAWMAAYTLFWWAACDSRKWGAIGYIVLTCLNISLYIAVKNSKLSVDYMSNMLFLDVLFSLALLYYYRRFR